MLFVAFGWLQKLVACKLFEGWGAWVHFRSHMSFGIECQFDALYTSYTHIGTGSPVFILALQYGRIYGSSPRTLPYLAKRCSGALHPSSPSPGHPRALRNSSSAECRRDDGAALCPRGSVQFRAGTHVHDFSRASAPSELCERPLLLILHPLRNRMRVSCGHAVCSLFRGTQCCRWRGASRLWTCPRLMERQGLSPLPVPFRTFDACPGIRPYIRALSAPPRLRMPLPRHPYIPPPLAWQWPGHVGSSPVTGQPAQLVPPPGPSAPTTVFPDMVGRPSTVLLPQFQAVVLGTRPSSSPTPVGSAASMPRLRSPGSRPAHIDVCHRMDFTQMPGGPRPLPPAQGFPLPFSIQPLPVSSPSTGLPGAQDFARLQTTGRLMS